MSPFPSLCPRYASTHPIAVKYVAFDFQYQCGAANYGRLELLWDEVQGDFTEHGFLLVMLP